MFPTGPTPISRRAMLNRTSVGFGSLALASLLGQKAHADASARPLAPAAPHFPARAKRIIFLFMSGGPSQVDTFDYKPLLTRDHGKPLPFEKPRVQFNATANLLQSPWEFKQHGESGLWVSDLFPHVAQRVDDLCMIHSMHGTNPAHGGAVMKVHTGSDNFVRPSIGSWVSYGLGTENQNPRLSRSAPRWPLAGSITGAPPSFPQSIRGLPLAMPPSPRSKPRSSTFATLAGHARFRRLSCDSWPE